MNEKEYICHVCGFDGLKEPVSNKQNEPSYEICPCCGFEFGFDDAIGKDRYENFRINWIKSGANWFMPKLKPDNWQLKEQLKNLKK